MNTNIVQVMSSEHIYMYWPNIYSYLWPGLAEAADHIFVRCQIQPRPFNAYYCPFRWRSGRRAGGQGETWYIQHTGYSHRPCLECTATQCVTKAQSHFKGPTLIIRLNMSVAVHFLYTLASSSTQVQASPITVGMWQNLFVQNLSETKPWAQSKKQGIICFDIPRLWV